MNENKNPELTEQEKSILATLVNPDAAREIVYPLETQTQSMILSLMLKEVKFLNQCLGLVQPNYFVNQYYRIICRCLLDYHEEYKKIPNKAILQQLIHNKINDKSSLLRTLGELNVLVDFYHSGMDDFEFLLTQVVEFAKTQALRQAFHKSLVLLTAGQEESPWPKIHEYLRQSMSVDRKFDIGLEYFQNLEEIFNRKEKEEETQEKFSLGFNTLDHSLNGGLTIGSMMAVMGSPGTGKSLYLVKSSIDNIRRGKKVLYLSLEMNQDLVADRFSAQLSDVGINDLLINKELIIKAVSQNVEDFEDERLLVIKFFPGGTLDVSGVRAYLSQLKLHNFKPDLVILDYIEEMKDFPGVPSWESKFRIVRDLRGLSAEEGFCLMTALQPNKDSRDIQTSSDRFLDDSEVATAYSMVKPLDLLISLNQTPLEKAAGVLRVFVIKSRNGESRISMKIAVNKKTLGMYEITDETYKSRMNNQSIQAASGVKLNP